MAGKKDAERRIDMGYRVLVNELGQIKNKLWFATWEV
jgi:hypothetical protein